MTRKQSNELLNHAVNLIFQVEEALSKDIDDITRKEGYRARIQIGNLQNLIRESRAADDISKEVYDNPLLNPKYKIL